MIKYILTFLMGCGSLFAQDINPYAPVSRISGNVVQENQSSIPTRHKTTIKYDRSPSIWNDDGWVQAEIVTVATATTNQIPASIQQVGIQYKATMESLFGVGAVTNEAIDRTYVAITLSLDTNVTADTGVRLRAWHEILSGYWISGSGNVHDFPYGQSEYVKILEAQVYEPFLFVNPDDVDFGLVAVGSTVTSLVNLVNARSTVITGTVSVVGSDFGPAVSQDFNLQSQTNQTFSITYSPLSVGQSAGTIVVQSNAGNYTNTVSGSAE
jgi:hypothetical protein